MTKDQIILERVFLLLFMETEWCMFGFTEMQIIQMN